MGLKLFFTYLHFYLDIRFHRCYRMFQEVAVSLLIDNLKVLAGRGCSQEGQSRYRETRDRKLTDNPNKFGGEEND